MFFRNDYWTDNSPSFQEIPLLQEELKKGDFIFREGTAYESAVIKRLSGSKYSHIGLIVQVFPEVHIIHATTDDNPNSLNQVIESSLPEFVDSQLANGWSVYRLNSLSVKEVNVLVEKVIEQKGHPFDISVKEEEGLYCTTLISPYLPEEIRQELVWSEMDIPGLKGELLFPNAFLSLRNMEFIYSQE